MQPSAIERWWETPGKARGRAAVSLHSHTSRSEEELKFLGGFRRQFPIIPAVLGIAARQHRRATGEALDISRAGWRPPLEPAAALALETAQIHGLGLDAMVSLSDHDNIDAGLSMPGQPVSVEWTVPAAPAVFHIGIHNLPRGRAPELWGTLREAAWARSAEAVPEALAAVAAEPETLVVLNHPLWDEAGAGEAPHFEALVRLLARCGGFIHALEINGLRSWAENARAAELAHAWRKPVVSGGDRHGAEPNAAVNITRASSFAEFAGEVREGHSTVALLPQYREPLRLRWLETVWDIVRSYPEASEGWRHWGDRFFYRSDEGTCRSVAEVWRTAHPPLLSQILALLRIAGLPPLRPALRLVLADRA